MSARTCPRRGCGEPLILRCTDTVTPVCVKCERAQAGVCRDCPSPTRGPRAMRCASCKVKRDHVLDRERHNQKYKNNPAWADAQRRRHRDARKDPATREHIVTRDRKYRAAHPRPRTRDDGDRLYARVWRKQHPMTQEQRDHHNAARRARYATDPEFRAKSLASNRDQYGRRHPRTPEQRERANAQFRERYANDPSFRAKVIGDVLERRARKNAAQFSADSQRETA